MSRWQNELSRIDWSGVRVSSGPATSVPDALRSLAAASTMEEGWSAYWQLDNTIVIQGGLFAAAEAVIPFVIDLAIEFDDHRRVLALELLIQLAGGFTHPIECEYGNVDLAVRCRERARTFLEFCYWLMESHDEEIRDRAVELVGLIESDHGRKEWIMNWVATHDASARIRQLAARLARTPFSGQG